MTSGAIASPEQQGCIAMRLFAAMLLTVALASHDPLSQQPDNPILQYLDRPSELQRIGACKDVNFGSLYKAVFLIESFPEMAITMDEFSEWTAGCKNSLVQQMENTLDGSRRFEFVYFLFSTFTVPEINKALVALSSKAKQLFGAVFTLYKFKNVSAKAIPILQDSIIYRAILNGPITKLKKKKHIKLFFQTAELALNLMLPENTKHLLASFSEEDKSYLYRRSIEFGIVLSKEIIDDLSLSISAGVCLAIDESLGKCSGYNAVIGQWTLSTDCKLNQLLAEDLGSDALLTILNHKLDLLRIPNVASFLPTYGNNFETYLAYFSGEEHMKTVLMFILRYSLENVTYYQMSAICFLLKRFQKPKLIEGAIVRYMMDHKDLNFVEALKLIWITDHEQMICRINYSANISNEDFMSMVAVAAKLANVCDERLKLVIAEFMILHSCSLARLDPSSRFLNTQTN